MKVEIDATSALSYSCRKKMLGWSDSVKNFLVYVSLENITVYLYCFVECHSHASVSLPATNYSFAKPASDRELEIVVPYIEFWFLKFPVLLGAL